MIGWLISQPRLYFCAHLLMRSDDMLKREVVARCPDHALYYMLVRTAGAGGHSGASSLGLISSTSLRLVH